MNHKVSGSETDKDMMRAKGSQPTSFTLVQPQAKRSGSQSEHQIDLQKKQKTSISSQNKKMVNKNISQGYIVQAVGFERDFITDMPVCFVQQQSPFVITQYPS